ncbi:hypothetical protein [Chitinophaga sp. XS-30]|uniref:hypothetical protein n=1 Tax=Chitinophaga sp. XS-30 TaxID=2604421 RepID=UPI0011DDE7D4|nr:hypothetical protein [Chitinophaga sp. XS-30]QEH39467.1 hypothetical protein FW415_00690 [Chitinophaga sp. XS-30]
MNINDLDSFDSEIRRQLKPLEEKGYLDPSLNVNNNKGSLEKQMRSNIISFEEDSRLESVGLSDMLIPDRLNDTPAAFRIYSSGLTDKHPVSFEFAFTYYQGQADLKSINASIPGKGSFHYHIDRPPQVPSPKELVKNILDPTLSLRRNRSWKTSIHPGQKRGFHP